MKALSQSASPQRAHLALAEALITLSTLDLPYGDLYLDRARTWIKPVFW